MSDYIFSRVEMPPGELTSHLVSIYSSEAPQAREFHGEWGSLALTDSPYHGFQVLETDGFICVVVGGPVLYFRDNAFLVGPDPTAGTQAILERWVSGKMEWDEDLSGPFVCLLVDKVRRQVSYVTDLMQFIPAYSLEQEDNILLGTHPAALASAAGQEKRLDLVSIADFILNNVVTHPYTVFAGLFQAQPASVHMLDLTALPSRPTAEPYWLPREECSFDSIDEAATQLRVGIKEYIDRVCGSVSEVAQFISAGEDSRAITGMLPPHLKRDAFIFLDSMNREGIIAKKVARKYAANFHVRYRATSHYLDMLPEAVDLIGPGQQYSHAHSLGLHTACEFNRYPAVFGGFLSDTLLKGLYVELLGGMSPVDRWFGPGEQVFEQIVMDEITKRRKAHLDWLRDLRPASHEEWFNIWPASMCYGMPYLYTNRRLFRSYEPFMCKEAIKISASVPLRWKRRRRLFNRAMRPFLKPSKWIFHDDGRLPYFSERVNAPIRFSVRVWRYFAKHMGLKKGNQGPWADWKFLMQDDAWNAAFTRFRQGEGALEAILSRQDSLCNLDQKQQINLLQTLYWLDSLFINRSDP